MSIIFNSNSDNLPLKFFDIGINWDQHKIYRPNGFDYFHWLQTDSGMGIIRIGNQRIKLNSGQGFLMRPNIPHSFFPDSNKSEWQTSFITFEGTAASELVEFLNLNDYQLYNHLDISLGTFIRRNFNTFKKTSFEDTLMQSNAIYTFLMLLRQNAYQNRLIFTDSSVTNLIVSYISSHYQENISNESFSNLTGYSISHTIRLFRDQTGETPLKYLTDFRLRMAKSLIIFYANLPINKISELVGFSSPSYFTKQFKDYFGKTPNQFRK
ncbi:AraC family transcriptional regulator [Lactiplantibacillus pentosus]|uniref:AraC family transcriptional regulator n=1 Tax=Lactiplantibacillus pentosus TaxID=1589 RepID=A0AAX6LHN3_LACPE|nr:AraC family transcriptional regulator [Lactiplantibacillus pentosus]MDF2314077.1 AraC family transcriptional regulator [Lactiplantibacillus pentosus]